MPPNTRTLKGQSYSTKRWANLAWPKGSKLSGFSSDVYVIKTLPENETQAHCLYMIYNHGQETQVNFLRGTSFEITDIEPIEGSEYKRIYMSEIRQ